MCAMNENTKSSFNAKKYLFLDKDSSNFGREENDYRCFFADGWFKNATFLKSKISLHYSYCLQDPPHVLKYFGYLFNKYTLREDKSSKKRVKKRNRSEKA